MTNEDDLLFMIQTLTKRVIHIEKKLGIEWNEALND